MALDITLNVYDPSNNILGRHFLYFGKALNGNLWQEWNWIKAQGFNVDGPWVFDPGKEINSHTVSKHQLSQWIEQRFLITKSSGEDSYSNFIDSYPEDSVFKLNFIDWS